MSKKKKLKQEPKSTSDIEGKLIDAIRLVKPNSDVVIGSYESDCDLLVDGYPLNIEPQKRRGQSLERPFLQFTKGSFLSIFNKGNWDKVFTPREIRDIGKELGFVIGIGHIYSNRGKARAINERSRERLAQYNNRPFSHAAQARFKGRRPKEIDTTEDTISEPPSFISKYKSNTDFYNADTFLIKVKEINRLKELRYIDQDEFDKLRKIYKKQFLEDKE